MRNTYLLQHLTLVFNVALMCLTDGVASSDRLRHRGGGRRHERAQDDANFGRAVDAALSAPLSTPLAGSCQLELLRAKCHCLVSSVTCINVQMTDPRVLRGVGHSETSPLASSPAATFIHAVTFHGNNFVTLPARLFGDAPVVHPNLRTLNLSANYVITVNASAFVGAPNVRVLDLSYNEIVLRAADHPLLAPLPELRKLYLRRSFNPQVNQSHQWHHLLSIFSEARLDHLHYLDLSYNLWRTVPYRLGCHLPQLTHLNLRQNWLHTLRLDTGCLARLETLDLTNNALMGRLDAAFRSTVSGLPDYSVVASTHFKCDCRSRDFIVWVRRTRKLRDKQQLRCHRASPARFAARKLVDVAAYVANLTCEIELDGRSNRASVSAHLATVVLCATSVCVALTVGSMTWSHGCAATGSASYDATRSSCSAIVRRRRIFSHTSRQT